MQNLGHEGQLCRNGQHIHESKRNPEPDFVEKGQVGRLMKLCLHLGCGQERIESNAEEKWVNIDIVPTSASDLVEDCKKLVGCLDGSVDEIRAYHLIEHFSEEEIRQAIVEWYRVLRPEGKLIIECPDMAKVCMEFAISDEKKRYRSYNGGPALINHIYGRPHSSLEAHKFGLTKDYLIWLLSELFENISFGEGHKDYRVPCICLECYKK
jgi:SAM-dependent methyltransferase